MGWSFVKLLEQYSAPEMGERAGGKDLYSVIDIYLSVAVGILRPANQLPERAKGRAAMQLTLFHIETHITTRFVLFCIPSKQVLNETL